MCVTVGRKTLVMRLFSFFLILFPALLALPCIGQDYNQLIVDTIRSIPKGGSYARYEKSRKGQEFASLHQTVADLDQAIATGGLGQKKLRVNPTAAATYSFCSSATYLLFVETLENLQSAGRLQIPNSVSKELADVGDKYAVIDGKLDGIGLFGHWNADGPGTAVLFRRLGLGSNFSSFSKARPGDFLKIFWNENIGKGERGHLVVYLGTSRDGKSILVWSSNLKNEDQSSGYGTMWVEKHRIKRQLFSRLEHPENIANWAKFSPQQKQSEYLIRIRKTGSTGAEMKQVTGALD